MIVMMIIVMLVISALVLKIKDTTAPGKNLSKVLPIAKVENDCIVSKQGDITIAFRLRLPEIFTLSNDDYETIHHVWIKAIKILPANTIVHKQDWFCDATYRANFDGQDEKSFLQRASERFFHERPYLDHSCYVMVTRKAPNRKLSSSVFSNLLRPSLFSQDTISGQALQEFLDRASQFEKLLEDGKYIGVKRLTGEQLAGTKEKPGLLERYCFLQAGPSDPLIRDIIFKPEWQIGEQYCQLYTMADVEKLPSLCGPRINYDKYSTEKTKFSVAFAAPVGQLLNCNHIYSQYIFIDDSADTLKKMESKRRRLQSLSNYSRDNAISRDATNAFLNEAISQQRQPVRAHFNVLVWTEDREQLKDLRNRASAALAQMDAVPHQEIKGAPQIYWAGLPGNEADFPSNECFQTFIEQATCFFNLETNYRSSISSFGLRLGDRISGKPVLVDISDEPMGKVITNRNKFLLGPSGSGKSFFSNLLVRSYYEQGTHVVIVDVGHSYKGLCTLVGGYYFTYEESNPIKFNPFFIAEGDSLDTEKKESIKTLLLSLWKKDNETYKRSEYVALSNALTAYYEHLGKHPDIFPCFNSFYEFITDYYVNILKQDKVKEKDFDIDNFLYVLRPYYAGGEFDYLLNAQENLDLLNERMIVFELDNIKDHPILFPAVTLIIMEVFISKMRKLKGIRKLILIEEAWKALMKEGFAEYIKYLFKTVRKFFGEAMVVTQDIEDIISSPIVKQAIINNSDCKILLDQSKYQNKFTMIQELLGLNDKEKALILSMNRANDPQRKYKEVFISLGGVLSKVYRTEVAPEEYLTYTTEEREKIKVTEYARKFGGMPEGIRALLQEDKQ